MTPKSDKNKRRDRSVKHRGYYPSEWTVRPRSFDDLTDNGGEHDCRRGGKKYTACTFVSVPV